MCVCVCVCVKIIMVTVEENGLIETNSILDEIFCVSLHDAFISSFPVMAKIVGQTGFFSLGKATSSREVIVLIQTSSISFIN